MCFSATASFTASAVLVPIGIHAIRSVSSQNARGLPLACIPLAFGVQQALEGVVWLGLHSKGTTAIEIGSIGFLLFAHWFWPFWLPFSVLHLENRPWARQVFWIATIVGCLYGAFLYLPLLIHSNWLSVEIVNGSIHYQTMLLYDRFFPRDVTRLIYVLLVLTPLFLSVFRELRMFGGLVAISVVLTYWAFNYAFISVWCFFAAVLSLYIARVASRLPNAIVNDLKETSR